MPLSYIEIAGVIGVVGAFLLVMARRLQGRIHRDEMTKPITFQSDLGRADRLCLMAVGYLFGGVFVIAAIVFFIVDCLK